MPKSRRPYGLPFITGAVACFALLTLSACVPVVSSRYEPHGSGKAYGPSGCSSNDSASMMFRLSNGVTFAVGARKGTKENPQIEVWGNFVLRPSQVAQLAGTSLQITIAPASTPISMSFDSLQVTYLGAAPDGTSPGMTTQAANAPMDGGPVGPNGIQRETYFGFSALLPFSGSPDFTVIFPAIVIDGKTTTIGPVTFKLITHPRIVGLAC